MGEPEVCHLAGASQATLEETFRLQGVPLLEVLVLTGIIDVGVGINQTRCGSKVGPDQKDLKEVALHSIP